MHALATGPTHWRRSAGDQIGHLWWRLLNGELPAVNQPGAVVVLIGARHAPHAAAPAAAHLLRCFCRQRMALADQETFCERDGRHALALATCHV